MENITLPEGFVWEDEDPAVKPITLPDGFVWEDEIQSASPDIPVHDLPGKNRRKRGRLYDTPKGPAFWNGNGWATPDDNDRQDVSQLDAGPIVPVIQPRRKLMTDAEMGITETPGTLGRFVNAAKEGFAEGYGRGPVVDVDSEDKFIPSPEKIALAGGETALRTLGGAVRGGTHLGAQIARELGMGDSGARRFERDLVGLVDTAAIVTGGRDLSGVSLRTANRHARQGERVKDIEAFDKLGIDPFAPALADAPLLGVGAHISSKVPVAGSPITSAVADGYESLGKSAKRIADDMSPNRVDGLEEAGEIVQKGLKRFSSGGTYPVPIETLSDADLRKLVVSSPSKTLSFSTKQEALYENAWRKLPARFKTNSAKNPDLVPTPASSLVLKNIERIQSKIGVSGGALQGKFSGMAEKLRNPRSNQTIETLRHMRTEVGRMLGRGPEDAVNMDRGELKELYGSITDDITRGLERIAERAASDPKVSNADTAQAFQAVQAFKRADQYTKKGIERLDKMLSLTNATTPERAADRLIKAGLSTGQGNLGLLLAARRSLRDEEWSDIASLMLKKMGEPNAGAKGLTSEIGYSPSKFSTQWNKLTPQAKQIVFGSQGKHTKEAIDALARISGKFSQLESLANHSNTFGHFMTSFATGGGAVAATSGWWPHVFGLFAGTYGYSKLLSSPAFARWVSRAARISENPGRGRQAAAHIAQLQLLAEKDPELSPLYESIAKQETDQPR